MINFITADEARKNAESICNVVAENLFLEEE